MNFEIMEEVLEVIENIIIDFEETELYTEHNIDPIDYFTKGGCGQFYTLLKSAFPQAIIRVTEYGNHVLTEIDGILYDVKGVYEEENVLDIDVTPSMEKLVTNYAFCLETPRWWGDIEPGPTNICFLQVLDEMEENERVELFSFLEEHDMTFFEETYDCWKDEDYSDEEDREVIEMQIDSWVFYDQVA